jgi:leader peptidase (prepilin peptidase)/N-methyltransferase
MAAFAGLLVLVSVMDLRHGRIPDNMVLLGLILGLIAASLQGTLLSGVLTGAGTFLGFTALALVYPSGIGGGDVKLAGVIGVILGWPAILWAVGVALVICGITGVAIGMSHNPKRTVAFGPFLAGGAVVGFLA